MKNRRKKLREKCANLNSWLSKINIVLNEEN